MLQPACRKATPVSHALQPPRLGQTASKARSRPLKLETAACLRCVQRGQPLVSGRAERGGRQLRARATQAPREQRQQEREEQQAVQRQRQQQQQQQGPSVPAQAGPGADREAAGGNEPEQSLGVRCVGELHSALCWVRQLTSPCDSAPG